MVQWGWQAVVACDRVLKRFEAMNTSLRSSLVAVVAWCQQRILGPPDLGYTKHCAESDVILGAPPPNLGQATLFPTELDIEDPQKASPTPFCELP